uniref:Uncharacterized protein n=1 Tax=Oryza glumipatula TaxID=40148 RepID=A0A0E0A9T8_9ORYZ
MGLRFGAWVTVVPLVALAGHRQQRRAQQQLDYDSTSLQTTGAGQQSAEAPGSALDEASSHPISTIATPLPVLPLAPSASRTKSPRLVLDHLAKAYRVLETTAQEAPFELNHLYVEMGSAGDKIAKGYGRGVEPPKFPMRRERNDLRTSTCHVLVCLKLTQHRGDANEGWADDRREDVMAELENAEDSIISIYGE